MDERNFERLRKGQKRRHRVTRRIQQKFMAFRKASEIRDIEQHPGVEHEQ